MMEVAHRNVDLKSWDGLSGLYWTTKDKGIAERKDFENPRHKMHVRTQPGLTGLFQGKQKKRVDLDNNPIKNVVCQAEWLWKEVWLRLELQES